LSHQKIQMVFAFAAARERRLAGHLAA